MNPVVVERPGVVKLATLPRKAQLPRKGPPSVSPMAANWPDCQSVQPPTDPSAATIGTTYDRITSGVTISRTFGMVRRGSSISSAAVDTSA